jgi:single-strand DNA-binding protein
MNSWNFTGNLGNDCEQRYTQSGDSVVSFSVGVKSGFGDKATTTWAKCAIFGKRGESVAPYLKKGTLVGISGEVNNREYQDKEGQKRYSLDVRVNDLTLLGGKSDRSESNAPSQPADKPQQRNAQGAQGGAFEDDDQIPF